MKQNHLNQVLWYKRSGSWKEWNKETWPIMGIKESFPEKSFFYSNFKLPLILSESPWLDWKFSLLSHYSHLQGSLPLSVPGRSDNRPLLFSPIFLLPGGSVLPKRWFPQDPRFYSVSICLSSVSVLLGGPLAYVSLLGSRQHCPLSMTRPWNIFESSPSRDAVLLETRLMTRVMCENETESTR